MRAYHDEEWGVPDHDSRSLWEALVLDGFQAGLSWSIILKKREGFRRAFHAFDAARVAKMTSRDVDRLMLDEGIVRARAKIEATIVNAKTYLAMEKGGEDFSRFVWGLAGGKTIRRTGGVPSQTPLSVDISKTLKKRGFKFVGPVTVYAWMQAVGMVDDHDPKCFRSGAGTKRK